MKRIVEPSGKRFGRYTVIGWAGRRGSKTFYECRCDCGNVRIVQTNNLRSGNSESCGCKAREDHTTHGLSYDPTYKSWKAMLQRCYDSNHPKYQKYGGGGILVCEFLRATPVNLIALIGKRPKNHTIDRIKNIHGYSCGSCSECLSKGAALNVRWSTARIQNQNRITTVNLTINGETKCVAEWARVSGINEGTLRSRISRGNKNIPLLSPPTQ